MHKVNLICHSVVALVMLFTIPVRADMSGQGVRCAPLFESNFRLNMDFTSSDKTIPLLKGVYLARLKNYDPKNDHQDFFSSQVPLVLRTLLLKLDGAFLDFSRIEKENFLEKPHIQKPMVQLGSNLKASYELLLNEANQRIESRTVTYEWYMNFFLKSIVFADVTARITDFGKPGNESFEILNKKLDVTLGKMNTIYFGDSRVLMLYSSLSPEFSKMNRSRYFMSYYKDKTVVPVLFVPNNKDIAIAESMGMYFVSMNKTKVNTIEGEKYPLAFAGLQMDHSLNKTSHVRNHRDNSILQKSLKDKEKGAARLDALYKLVLKDINQKKEHK